MTLLMYILGKEILEHLSITDEKRLDKHIANLPPNQTIPLLMNALVLLGLSPSINSKEYIQFGEVKVHPFWGVQNFLAQSFFSPTILNKLTLRKFNNRPVFSRHQLLYLIKKVLRLGDNESKRNPNENQDDRFYLGRVCLDISNFLIPQEQEKRTSESYGEQALDEMILQMLPSFELDNPPDIDYGIARTLEYLRIFSTKCPSFIDDLSIDEYFKERTGISLNSYLDFIAAIYTHYLSNDLIELFQQPAEFNLSKSDYFSNYSPDEDELKVFFELTSKTIFELKNELIKNIEVGTKDQYDFTTFRKYSLVFITDDIFTCLDIGFLLEKVSFGLYRTIHNALPDDIDAPNQKEKKLASKLSSNWGDTVEKYVFEIFSDLDGFYPDVKFKSGKSKNEQIDGVFSHNEDILLIEVKGGTLSAKEKYSGEKLLLDKLNKKFGIETGNSGVGQLVRDIELLYNNNEIERSKLKEFNYPVDFLKAKNIYPILIIEESSLRLDLVQRKLRLWFEREVEKKRQENNINNEIEIKTLLILPIEVLEAQEPFLKAGEFTFLEFVQFYDDYIKKSRHIAMTDANSVFQNFIKERQIEWRSNARLDNIFSDFMDRIKERLES